VPSNGGHGQGGNGSERAIASSSSSFGKAPHRAIGGTAKVKSGLMNMDLWVDRSHLNANSKLGAQATDDFRSQSDQNQRFSCSDHFSIEGLASVTII
jgi:hypothetical protein